MSERIVIAGAGLAGSLLALFLARRGFVVEVFERRGDPRQQGYAGGRSINLALAERGMHALRRAGLEREVLAQAVMMRGRMVHHRDGSTQLLPYGRDDSEVIWSVHRGRLNLTLVQAAEAAGARIHFNQRLHAVDFPGARAVFFDEAQQVERTVPAPVLIGADGAGSALRTAMHGACDLGERFESLGHGYKELEIPPGPEHGWRIEPHALHIWPRGGYMCIALPNVERTFTVTLFLPNEGTPGFSSLREEAQVRDFFLRDFPDAVPLIPDLLTDFTHNPTGTLGTLRLRRWHFRGQALLIGDAAHAILPFHGQGMNCAFEDCVELDDLLSASHDYEAVFQRFQDNRQANANAIADMAIENYLEMRDKVDDPQFLFRKQIERELARRYPDAFVPRYSMVTFRRTPYALAQARGARQWQLVESLAHGRDTLEAVDWDQADAWIRSQPQPA